MFKFLERRSKEKINLKEANREHDAACEVHHLVPSIEKADSKVPEEKRQTDANESIIYEAKLHWSIYVVAVTCFCYFLLISLAAIANAQGADGGEGIHFAWVVMNLPVIALIGAALRQYTSHVYITNKRLVTRTGLLSRQSSEILLAKIESVSVTQSALERLVDCGDVQLTGTGSARRPIREIAAPTVFRDYLTKAIAQENLTPSPVNNAEVKKREAATVIAVAVMFWFVMTTYLVVSTSPIFNSAPTSIAAASVSNVDSTPPIPKESKSVPAEFTGQYIRKGMIDGTQLVGAAGLRLVKRKGEYTFNLYSRNGEYSSAASGTLKFNGAKTMFESQGGNGTIAFSLYEGAGGKVINVIADPDEAFGSSNSSLSGLYILDEQASSSTSTP